ncbi:MAG: DUF4337 domain-containing protein [Magnetococcales bacterium]|nr:DUF4337 domain-containing protein [Magnetococcales bacterium]
MEIRETQEMVEEAGEGGHGGHGHGEGEGGKHNKRIAIMISLLACILATVEMGGKSAQHNSMSANIEAANLWSFFQAKTIRMTLMKAGSEFVMTNIPADLAPEKAEALKKFGEKWKAEAARFDSEPETKEGRKELMARAKESENKRDKSLAAYHLFEYAAAALQISIVLAAASVTTSVIALAYGAGMLGALGALIGLVGWLAPTAIHL